MTIQLETVKVHTEREEEIIDLTEKVQSIVADGPVRNGVAFLFIPGSTAALTTMEYEPGLIVDLPNMLETIAPKKGTYEHEKRWHDGNGHSHVRAALLGADLSVPIVNGRLTLGTWQ